MIFFCHTFQLQFFLGVIMSVLQGLYLSQNCFAWGDGVKKDGTPRSAGRYVGFLVYEQGPTPMASQVIEVQVPDELHTEFLKRAPHYACLDEVSFHVQYTMRGKARLLAFGD